MEKVNKILDKLLELAPGGFYGLLSIAISLIGHIIPILLFPGGYSIFHNMVSELGTSPGAIFFNLGFILSGIVAIPFYISLARSFNYEDMNEKLRKSAITMALISITTFILIGVFPAIIENIIILYIHGTLAVVTWLSGMSYMTLFSILMLKDKKYKKIQAYLGFLCAGLFLLTLLTWMPITEWMLSFGIIVWVTVNSIYTLYHKI